MTEPKQPYMEKRTYLPDPAVKALGEGLVAMEEERIEVEFRAEAAKTGHLLIGEPRHVVCDLHDPRTAEAIFGNPYPDFLPSRWMIHTVWPLQERLGRFV